MGYKKKYKEALERAREFQKSKDGLCVLTAECIFPELGKSEDERIRKELIDAINGLWVNDALPLPLSVGRKDKWIAWLEKQGEHDETSIAIKNPEAYRIGFADGEAHAKEEMNVWSDEDEEMIDKIIDYMKPMPIFFESTKGKSGKEYTKEFIKNAIKWLKSIKGRIQPQQKWTEEDENGFGETLWAINKARTIAENENDMGNLWYAENWLKSLKERLKNE